MNDKSIRKELKRIFGFASFKENQEAIVSAVLEGRDVFAAMPTGGGKSLCYQLPAALLGGLSVVVSPLISLMKDQVDAAKLSGMSAEYLNSSLDRESYINVLNQLRSGKVSLLYVAPERFSYEGFTGRLKELSPALFAVDEAHCISEWGHEFRPEYRNLSRLRRLFPGVPIAAFTATATVEVQKDIVKLLKLKKPLIVRAGFNRKELTYRAVKKDSVQIQILEFIEKRKQQPGIVYRYSRKAVEKTADFLNRHGIRSAPYHAGLTDEERRNSQDDFINDRIQVVVATIAFGMGIDKSNVRFVIHGDLPRSIEGYYQETGRAGRDGEAADCLLLYGPGDSAKVRYHIKLMNDENERRAAEQRLSVIESFASSVLCRRKMILSHFQEEFSPPCGNCDVCLGEVETIDAVPDAKKFLSAAVNTGERFGAHHLADLVTGTDSEKVKNYNHHHLPVYGAGADKPKHYWLDLADQLLLHGHLFRPSGRYASLKLSASGKELLNKANNNIEFKMTRCDGVAEKAEVDTLPVDQELFGKLKRLRKSLAKKSKVPPYMVFSDKTLKHMCRLLPESRAEMLKVSGVGEAKLDRYGDAFMKEIREAVESGVSR